MRIPMTIKTLDEGGAINDIRIDPATGDLAFVKGKDAYAVIIADAVRTVEGELQYNTGYGIPYFSTVFASVGLRGIWRSRISEMVHSMPFVKSIGRLDVSFDTITKKLSYSLEVATDDGEMTISQ